MRQSRNSSLASASLSTAISELIEGSLGHLGLGGGGIFHLASPCLGPKALPMSSDWGGGGDPKAILAKHFRT